MASAISLLSEEQFLCSICLDVFTEPVSTPCGHKFCKSCITRHWESKQLSQCPLCNEKFHRRPELRVNTGFRDVVENFKKLNVIGRGESLVKPGEVPCDFCSGTKRKALKSCLVCLASYCETHLEPHQRVAAWKRHKLIDPVENLEDRMCKKHDKFLDLFCRTDQICVCVMCTEHKTHDTVPLEEEYEEKKAQLGKKKAEVQEMIQERQQKIQEMKVSVQLNKKDTEEEIAKSVEVFTALVASIQRNQAELIEVIEEKQRAAEKQAEGFIKELEQEISELQRRSTELERLSHTEDHLHLLQSFPSCSSSPHTNNWSGISVRTHLCVETVRRAMTTLLKHIEGIKEDLEKLPEDVRMRRIQQLYAVDVTLDPDTAHPKLILSEDGKQVRCGNRRQNLPDNPERFNQYINILGKEGFSSGKIYFEVQVKGTDWDLGVVRESSNRKGEISYSPEEGYWIIWLRDGNDYKALDDPSVSLSLREKPEKVGVFVDHEEGLVSFYDVEAETLIYPFTGCTFKEKIYPFFCPSYNEAAPLIITPVKYTE
uniref:E3 ubiquitin-protein ligase TRIM21-like isoform X2 n=1 Tax=Centroberyx gerrardi TaxID=166262 RepID=UPI003AADC079